MKSNLLLLSIVLLFGCNMNKSSIKEQNTTSGLIGGQKDSHGCLTSAGYTWSELEQTCIRPFEKGIPLESLDSTSSYQTAAFLLIKDSLAEVFIPEKPYHLILKQEHKDSYHYKNYSLLKENHHWTFVINKKKKYQEK